MGYRLGVDLGTTFTAAAVRRDGVSRMTPLGLRQPEMPSVVAVTVGDVRVGDAAEYHGRSEPASVARFFKRRFADSVPLVVNGQPWSAEALSARVLSRVLEQVTQAEGSAPDHVVLTHPAGWREFRLDAMHAMAEMAELSSYHLVPEPVAAARHYAESNRLTNDARLAVFDFGGGTFDTSVVSVSDGEFEVVGIPQGIDRLGGIDIDEAVFAHACDAAGIDPYDLPDSQQITRDLHRLRLECRDAKEILSSAQVARIAVRIGEIDTEVELTREAFESMLTPMLDDAGAAVDRAIRMVGLGFDEIDALLLVGGTSRIPAVGRALSDRFGRPILIDTHPKHAVALGASLSDPPSTLAVAPQPTGPGGQVPPAQVSTLTEPGFAAEKPADSPSSAPAPTLSESTPSRTTPSDTTPSDTTPSRTTPPESTPPETKQSDTTLPAASASPAAPVSPPVPPRRPGQTPPSTPPTPGTPGAPTPPGAATVAGVSSPVQVAHGGSDGDGGGHVAAAGSSGGSSGGSRTPLIAALVALALVVAGGLALAVTRGDGGGGDLAATTTTQPVAQTTTTSTPTTEASELVESTTTTAADSDTTTPQSSGDEVVVAAGESIQIRVLADVSGSFPSVGEAAVDLSEQAVEDFGAVMGFEVSTGTVLDTQCSNAAGIAAGRTVANTPDVIGVVGPQCSGSVLGAAQGVTESGAVMVTPAGGWPTLTSDRNGVVGPDNNEGFFRLVHNDLSHPIALSDYARNELQLSRAGVVHLGVDFELLLSDAFVDRFESTGGEVVSVQNLGTDAQLETLAETFINADVEFVYVLVRSSEAASVLEALDGQGDWTLGASHFLFEREILENPASEGMLVTAPAGLSLGDINQATGRSGSDLLTQFDSAPWRGESVDVWARSYDATTLLLSAIEASSTVQDGNLVIDRVAVAAFLADVSNFAGVSGSITCDEFGDCARSPLHVLLNVDPLNFDAVEVVREETDFG